MLAHQQGGRKIQQKKTQLQVHVSSCAWLVRRRGRGRGGRGGWKCVIAPKLVELLAKKREREKKNDGQTAKEKNDGAPRLPQAVKFKGLVI